MLYPSTSYTAGCIFIHLRHRAALSQLHCAYNQKFGAPVCSTLLDDFASYEFSSHSIERQYKHPCLNIKVGLNKLNHFSKAKFLFYVFILLAYLCNMSKSYLVFLSNLIIFNWSSFWLTDGSLIKWCDQTVTLINAWLSMHSSENLQYAVKILSDLAHLVYFFISSGPIWNKDPD